MSLRFRSWIFTAVSLASLGCDETKTGDGGQVAIGHANAALTAQQNTERALRGYLDSTAFLTQSSNLASLLGYFGSSSSSCTASPCAVGDTTCIATPTCTTEESTPDLAETHADLLEAVDDLVAFMRDDLFTEANLESDDGTTSIYKLGPDLFCDNEPMPIPTSPIGGTGGTTATTTTPEPNLDPDCVADVEKLAPRLKLSSPSQGNVDLSLLLTNDRVSPVTFQLHQDRLGARVDLGAIKTAADRAGVSLEDVGSLSGVLQGQLLSNGALDYSVSLGVTEMVSMVLGEAPQQFTVTLAPSPKAFEARFNGNARTIQGAVDLATFALQAPLGAFFDDDEENYDPNGNPTAPKAYSGTIRGQVIGAQGSFDYNGATDLLSLDDFGFGAQPSTVQHDTSTILSVDVNANANHRFNLIVDSDADGTIVEASPALDIGVMVKFATLANQVADIEQFLLNDVFHVTLGGTKPRVRIEDGQFRVLSGTLSLRSETSPSYQVVANTDMCMTDAETSTNGPSLVSEFVSGTCQ